MSSTEKFPSQDSNGAKGDTASSKEKYDFLAALLKDTRHGLVDFGFKQSAVVTLLIGWIVSSDKAREFVIYTPHVRSIAVVTTILYFLHFAFWTWTYRSRSLAAYKHLLALDFMPKEYYAPLAVTQGIFFSFLLMQGTSCAALGAYIFATGHGKP